MTCLEALELLHARADGDPAAGFDDARAAELESHVASCADCAKAARQIQALRSALRTMPAVRAPDGFRDGVMHGVTGGGRLVAFPRFLVPLAAAAVLVAAFVVVQRARDGIDVAKSEGANSLSRGTADVPLGEWDAQRGLTAKDALEAARSNGPRQARKASEEAHAADLDEKDAGGLAAEGLAAPSSAPAPGAAAPPADPADPPPGAPAKSPASPAAPVMPPKPGAPQDRQEDKATGSLRDLAKNESVPAAVRVVVFRNEADALAFVASLGADGEEKSDAGVHREDAAPPASGSSEGGVGRGPTGGGVGGGGGAGGGSGGGKPAPARAPSEPTGSGATAAVRVAAPVRLVRRASVTTDAWRRAAVARNGSIIETPELVLRPGADPTPESLALAVDAWRRSVLQGAREKSKSARDAEAAESGDEPALKKDAGGGDRGAAPAPVPATPPADAVKIQAHFEKAGEVLLVVVQTAAPPR